jgi:hypothetical protein
VEVIEGGISLKKGTCFKLELDEAENLSNYTVAFDIKVPSHTWRGLLQANLKNNEDAGLFINGNGQVGLSVNGFGYGGSVPTNEWCKIAIVVKEGLISVYIDGELAIASTNTNNNRWIMDKSGAYLFCDNDGETADIDIAGIHFWNKAFTAEQIASFSAVQ